MDERCDRTGGQGTVEWVGLLLLVTGLFTALALGGARVPGVSLAHAISTRMLCAVALVKSCAGEVSLDRAYGEELAALVRANAPELMYGPDLLGLPVDFRTCRAAACADPPGEGEILQSTAGERVTLFTRIVDCRENGAGRGDKRAGGEDCDGNRAGSLFIQYWAYYPESASLRGAPVLEEKGYHPHDWESTQVRIGADGRASARASSHSGYNHSRSALNWGSDIGWKPGRRAVEIAGLRQRGGWGEATGKYLIAGGSHAGNLRDDGGDYPSHTPADRVKLVPLESIQGGPLVRPADFTPITPPWKKRVWRDPEAESTG